MTETVAASAADLDIVTDLTRASARSRQVCSIERLRESRPELAAEYAKAIGQFSDTKIAVWITAHGFPISDSAVRSHRVGECQRCQTISSRT